MSNLDNEQTDTVPSVGDRPPDDPPNGSGERTEWVDQDQLTRAQKALLALSGDVAHHLAEDHGVCVRPLAMRRLDLTSGRVDVIPVPCGSRWEDRCRPCADKNRRQHCAGRGVGRRSRSPTGSCGR